MRFTSILGAAALTLAAAAPAFAQSAAGQAAEGSAAAQSPPASNASTTAASPGGAASASGALSVGLPVKDKTGTVIGQITELKPGAGGETATVKMGEQSFAIGAQSFVVQNGAAVINATQAQLQQMISSAKGGG